VAIGVKKVLMRDDEFLSRVVFLAVNVNADINLNFFDFLIGNFFDENCMEEFNEFKGPFLEHFVYVRSGVYSEGGGELR